MVVDKTSTLFKPVIVGGQDISSLRPHFDCDDRHIIVASDRRLLYFNVTSCQQDAEANIPPSKLEFDENIVAFDKIETTVYLFTNYGKIFTWNLEDKDWVKELALVLDLDTERLISCKMLSKRQYVFSVINIQTDQVHLYWSGARSERERPKQRELIGQCTDGKQTSFDIGCTVGSNELDRESTKAAKEKLAKQRALVFIEGPRLSFQQVGIGEKFHLNLATQTIANQNFTCVRANGVLPIVAAGDTLGRIYIYSGNFNSNQPWANRTKLHWHSSHVNDLAFSATGNTLYSVGSESGCVVVWDLSQNHLGEKKVIASLGMPIRHVACCNKLQQLVVSSEDNELQFIDTDHQARSIKTLTRRTYDMYLQNDSKALRFESSTNNHNHVTKSIGNLWHPKTDTIVMNSKTGCLQFYSPKLRVRTDSLDCLKSGILSLEPKGKVLPSEITQAAFSADGDWLAFFETRESENLFPDVKLHIWQRSNTLGRWFWIQTADRIHSSAAIADLKFSPDGQYLVSVCEDGTFQVLHRVCLDVVSNSKQMYAKGFFSNIHEGKPSLAAFSRDSSVLAISLENNTTLIWTIVDPFKFEYEIQLSRLDSPDVVPGRTDMDNLNSTHPHRVLGLQFGRHEATQDVALLCEVRSRYIRIWNILDAQTNPEKTIEFLASDATPNSANDEFTAVAFDQCQDDNQNYDRFATSSRSNLVQIYQIKVNPTSRELQTLIIIDASLPLNHLYGQRQYVRMCFLQNSVVEMDSECLQDQFLLKLVNRLCLVTSQQELVSLTDRLTVERQLAINNCNEIKSYETGELEAYFSKSISIYTEELTKALKSVEPLEMTEKQRRIKQKMEFQKMVKHLFTKIPSHKLPTMEVLAPIILNQLIIN